MLMWTIKFNNGKWSYLDPTFISSRRTDAWNKWKKEWSFSPSVFKSAMAERRKGWYRAVRIEVTEVEAATGALNKIN